jgi:hypothetical protein
MRRTKPLTKPQSVSYRELQTLAIPPPEDMVLTLLAALLQKYLFFWYTSINTDAKGAATGACAPEQAALCTACYKPNLPYATN